MQSARIFDIVLLALGQATMLVVGSIIPRIAICRVGKGVSLLLEADMPPYRAIVVSLGAYRKVEVRRPVLGPLRAMGICRID